MVAEDDRKPKVSLTHNIFCAIILWRSSTIWKAAMLGIEPKTAKETREMYLLMAIASAVVGVFPLLISKKPVQAVVQFLVTFFISWFLFYWNVASTVYPLFGMVGFFTFIWWIVAAIVDAVDSDGFPLTSLFPTLGACLYIVVVISNSGMLNASEYANMISSQGTVEERVWTQDIQPKDPAHMRMGTYENALYRGKAIIGRDGAIGSQFEVNEYSTTVQKVGKELIVAIPLDYSGYGSWSNTPGVPGYIKVSAEDPHRDPEFVTLPKGHEMRYTPYAWFSYNLERHLRNNGYSGLGLTDYTFEIDDNSQEWFVVTVFKPTIGWSGEKVIGIVVVNPYTGEITYYDIDKVPDWVDRVVPGLFVKHYLSWNGRLLGGWGNAHLPWAAGAGLTEPAEDPMLIYGTGDQAEWVTDITSTNNADHSLVALVYTNSRTGKSIRYQMAGGATSTKVLQGVNENSEVKYKQLHGAAVQLYNVFGVPTAVVPLLNNQHAFQGVAMVPINDFQLVAVGPNPHEAQRAYEKMLSERDQRVSIEAKRDLQHIEGVVSRAEKEALQTGTVCYIYVEGTPHLFTGGPGLSSKLIMTKPGDKVKIGFYSSDKDVVPMTEFDNLSLPLSRSPLQIKLDSVATEHRSEQEAVEDSRTVLERMKNMDPKELQKLGKQIPK